MVYSSGPSHWVAVINVRYKKTAKSITAEEEWLECDGQKDTFRETNGRTLNPKINSGAVARVLLKRVYKECEDGVYLKQGKATVVASQNRGLKTVEVADHTDGHPVDESIVCNTVKVGEVVEVKKLNKLGHVLAAS